jgi:hypothetical protein
MSEIIGDLIEICRGKIEGMNYHTCDMHNVHEVIIREKGLNETKIDWFLCHLTDRNKYFIDCLIEVIILWRLRENKKKKIKFNKKKLEKIVKEKMKLNKNKIYR